MSRFQKMHDLTGFQRDLLALIGINGEAAGLRIKEQYEDRYGVSLNHGRLYPNLDTLVEKGLVNKGQFDDRTNRYTLTPRGGKLLEDRSEWLEDVVENL